MIQRIDFSRKRERASLPALWLLTSGGLILAGSAVFWQLAQQARHDAQTVLTAAQARQDEQARARQEAAQRAQAQQALLDDKRWRDAAEDLHLPWLRVLSAVEAAARPPAYLLAARLDPARDQVELEAVAPGFEEALAVLGTMQGRPELHEPRLLSREGPNALLTTAGATSDMRFVIQARWGRP